MANGDVAVPEVQRHPPGQEARLSCPNRAQFSQPAGGAVRGPELLARDDSGRVVRLDEYKPRVSLPPGTALGPEQPVGSLGPVSG